ncbi:MAG TPA: FGGY family carbohydrate kinase [Ktedonobacteraceae bacterium]|nr:FGGY family carbohydrate kinase [Ktedonobacteraceae bacterium]
MTAPGEVGIIGIDLGTSSAKVLIIDGRGKTLGAGRADYAVLTPQPGWAESDPAAWRQAVVSAVRAAMAQAGQPTIAGIGLSGQMHGVVLADDQGRALRPALLWPDSRAGAELEGYRALPEDALQRLANPLAPGMAGPLLCWLARHEAQIYHAARRALQPKDWLRMCLTGAAAGAATDPSDASATLLYDLPADGWADDVIAALGLRRDLFPPILPSGASAGTLSTTAAGALGLPVGLPIATGAADTAAAALGAGLLSPGPIQLTLGTGAQLIQICAEPLIDATLRTHLYRAADGVNWFRMAAVQNAGLALDWVRRVLAATWDELYASAGNEMLAPGADGLLFLPYLTPERFVHDQHGGAFLGLRIDHGREHLLRAALEGVAFGIRTALEMLPGASAVNTLRLVGGGSAHPAWRQLLADVLGRELLVVDASDASARGAVLLGGIAAGVWADTAATAALAPGVSAVVTPDAGRARLYDEVYGLWGHDISL